MINRNFPLGTLLVAGVLLLLSPLRAPATSSQMVKLPNYSTFQCAICHMVSRPSAADAELNPFGADFQTNGNVWNKTLALKNSDGDKCPNGFELGDLNGDGVPDEAGGVENSNPGVQDCDIALSKQTWGIIKDLFSGE